jgi:hypothetical protein
MDRVRKPLLNDGARSWTSDSRDASEVPGSSKAPRMQPSRDADPRKRKIAAAADGDADVSTDNDVVQSVAKDGSEVAKQRVGPTETAFDELSVGGNSLRNSADGQMDRSSPAVFCNPLWLSS